MQKNFLQFQNLVSNDQKMQVKIYETNITCRAGSDGSMSASGSAGPGFDPRRGSKFSTSGLGGVEMYTF